MPDTKPYWADKFDIVIERTDDGSFPNGYFSLVRLHDGLKVYGVGGFLGWSSAMRTAVRMYPTTRLPGPPTPQPFWD